MRQIWAPWRMEFVEQAQPPGGCVLCGLSNDPAHRQAGHVVERTDLTFTVLNLYPYTSGHVMVVPHRHAARLTDLSATEAAALIEGGRRAVLALTETMSPEGFNLGINHGHAAGAGMDDHLHLHVVPRWEGDTNFMPVLADVRVLPDHLDRTAARLREAYATLGAALEPPAPAP